MSKQLQLHRIYRLPAGAAFNGVVSLHVVHLTTCCYFSKTIIKILKNLKLKPAFAPYNQSSHDRRDSQWRECVAVMIRQRWHRTSRWWLNHTRADYLTRRIDLAVVFDHFPFLQLKNKIFFRSIFKVVDRELWVVKILQNLNLIIFDVTKSPFARLKNRKNARPGYRHTV